jgi:hypothetical protein
MTDVELARAIYAHHRRAALRAKRRTAPVPSWDELAPAAQEQRVRAAAALRAAYATAGDGTP